MMVSIKMIDQLQKHQSYLAKLLAKENVTIQHGNFKSAFFDVKNRVLGLPIWKDKGKDVYDLLVGHEVGHALYTPSWDPSTFRCPSVYVNVVEDVRIEKLIQSTYPGLVACFRRGYSVLFEDNFFGTKDKDIQSFGFADRLNVKAKLGPLVELKFSAEEQVILDLVNSAQTWEEVLHASEVLYKFCKEEANQNPPPEGEAGDSEEDRSEESGSEDGSPPSGNDQGKAESDSKNAPGEKADKSQEKGLGDSSSKADAGNGEESSTKSDADEQEKSGKDQGKQKKESSTVSAGKKGSRMEVEPSVFTAEHFEEQASKLVDLSREILQTEISKEHTRPDWAPHVIPFAEVFKNRDQSRGYASPSFQEARSRRRVDFAKFNAEAKKYVGTLTKEFELRKSAYRYSRAQTTRTGMLDLNKLHSYRTRDDIFLSVTSLADAKNHGMIMVIDFSGSMSGALGSMVQHTIQLCMFCKKIGIPFSVYSFTDSGASYLRKAKKVDPKDSQLDLGNLVLNELVSSRMTKVQLNRAYLDLYVYPTSRHSFPDSERMGGTPLVEMVTVAHHLVKDFIAENKVEKMITMFITDGEGGYPRLVKDATYSDHHISGPDKKNIHFNILGRKFTCALNSPECTAALVENLRKTTGSKVLGFYIPSSDTSASSQFDLAVKSAPQKVQAELKKKFADRYPKDRCISAPGLLGYDDYFVVAPAANQGYDSAFGDTTSRYKDVKELTSSFVQHTVSRKSQRVFLSEFAKAIA